MRRALPPLLATACALLAACAGLPPRGAVEASHTVKQLGRRGAEAAHLLAWLASPMSMWREMYFTWMLRNAQSATDYYRIPAKCVVELGALVEI